MQVTKDAQDQYKLERAQPELVPPRPQNSPQQVPEAACPEPSNPDSPPTQRQSESLAQPPASPAPVNTGQLLPQPPQSSSASVTSTNSSQAAVRSEQPWLHPPLPNTFGPAPQDLASYYYYRPLYDAYQSQYPSPYPSDPGTASLYYQVRALIFNHLSLLTSPFSPLNAVSLRNDLFSDPCGPPEKKILSINKALLS